jgi:uncharacterized protein
LVAAPDRKLSDLRDLLCSYERVVVAFSGGVDSTFLTAVAHEVLDRSALAVTAVSPSLPRRELDAARALATERGWNHSVVGTHEVGREQYARNRADRCYWCKDTLFETLVPIAEQRRAVVAVGTNVDDLGEHRPGLKAAVEWGAVSPLVEAGLLKSEIRTLSRLLELPTADKPAGPCLASRFAYGVRVTAAGLRRIEAAEEYLLGLGFDEVRVRDEGDRARVEVGGPWLSRALQLESEIGSRLIALGFETAHVDRRGYRRGSMNEALLQPTIKTASGG